MHEKVIDIHADSVEDFLANISPTGKILRKPTHKALQSNWLFRGVSNSEYSLIPSAFREPSLLNVFDKYVNNYDQYPFLKQISREFFVLHQFFNFTDEAGLEVPGDTYQFRRYLELDSSRFGFEPEAVEQVIDFEWPRNDYFFCLGLAQHYGIPTRLLDWTSSVDIAAYFSAQGGERRMKDKKETDGNIAVWALNHALLIFEETLSKRYARDRPPPDRPIKVVGMPNAANPNLRAQKGVFTVFQEKANTPISNENNMGSLDEQIFGYWKEIYGPYDLRKEKLLVRFTLPIQFSSELLRNLSLRHIHHANVFPNYGDVFKGIKQRFELESKS